MAEPKIFDSPAAYTDAEQRRALPRMLMEGTPALRRDSKKWCPPYNAAEEAQDHVTGDSFYKDRIRRTIVEPYFSETVKRTVATILGKAIVLDDDVPAIIRKGDNGEGWWENIDLRGNNGDVFWREVVKDAAGEGGYSLVLADHPPKPGEDATDADLESLRLRPYLRHYRACDKIEAIAEYIDGRQRLGYLKLADTGDHGQPQRRIIRPAPWNPAARAYLPGAFVTWELWEEVKGDDGKVVEVRVGTGTMAPHREIPLTVLYFNQTGFIDGVTPYQHLADMNLLHTQNASDFIRDLLRGMGATLHRAGLQKDEEKQTAIGPGTMIWSTNDGASAEFLTYPTGAFEPMATFQQRSEDKMKALGNMPDIGRTGNVTATSTAIDTAEAKTETEARQIVTKDAIELSNGHLAAYKGLPSGGSVTLPRPAKYTVRDDEGFKVLKEMVNDGQLTRKTLLETAVQQGIGGLAEDLDIKAELTALDAEKAAGQARAREIAAGMAATVPAQPGAPVPPVTPPTDDSGTVPVQ